MMRPELVTLSAPTDAVVGAAVRSWLKFLESDTDSTVGEIARSAALGQHHLRARLAFVVGNREELVAALRTHASGAAMAGESLGRPPKIAFVFSGGGSQWPRMGLGLADEPVFAAAMAECDALIRREMGWSVLEQIELPADRSQLDRLEVFLPTIFAIQVALARLWREWGIHPSVVIGHSMGEIPAAHVAGSLSLEDAVRAVTSRSRVMSRPPSTGKMALVGLSLDGARRALRGREAEIFIAATNGPRMTALSGRADALTALLEELTNEGVFCRFVKGLEQAHHSPLMEPLVEPYATDLSRLTPRRGDVPMFSTLESRFVDGCELDGRYWARNMLGPVRFFEAIAALAREGVERFIELSPHPVLLPGVDDTLSDLGKNGRTVASLHREDGERATMLAAAAALYRAGAELDFNAMFAGARGGREPAVPIVEPARAPAAPARLEARGPVDEDLPKPSPAQQAEPEGTAGEALSPVHEALIALEEMQAELDAERAKAREPIAIVAIACRYPGGANTPEKLWSLLERGVDCSGEIPRERFDIEPYYDPAGGLGKSVTRSCALLELSELQGFDPLFFGLSPHEAMEMDPQHRLLVEVTHEALERGGYAPERLAKSRTGVFVGICSRDYFHEIETCVPAVSGHTVTGNIHSFAAGRLAYLFDFRGPAILVDTACSSSAVAAHLACRSLRNRECDLAVVGGVNVIVSPLSLVFYSQINALCPDGRAKAFDARANGTNRGEGCGVVVLKRLSDARAAGDRILGVIRGTALNQDGRSNGMTAPSVHAQEAVIRDALEDAGLAPSDVECIEAHGTGTKLGDPIEIEALKAVYGVPRASGRSCAVTTIKTNIGHTEACAGVSGIIKAVLSLQNKAIPGLVHLRELNPHIDLAGSCLSLSSELQAWPSTRPRRMAVSSFGASGTNAHIVVEEAPEPAPERSVHSERPHLLTVSARTKSALGTRIAQLVAALETEPALDLADASFTLNVGRSHLAHRVAVVARSKEEAIRELTAAIPWTPPVSPPRVAFSFGGAAPALDSARALYRREPVVRAVADRIDQLFTERSGIAIGPILRGGAVGRGLNAEESAALAFALAAALAALFRSFGIEPSIVHGSPEGEIAARHIAGALDEAEAAASVLERLRTGTLRPRPRGSEIVPLVVGDAPLDVDVVLRMDPPEPSASHDAPALFALTPDGELAPVLAELYRRGIGLDFAVVHRSRPGRRVLLPSYPFERVRHWAPILDAPPERRLSVAPAGLRGRALDVAGSDRSIFERSLSADSPRYLGDHRLFGMAVLPAAAHIELMLANVEAGGAVTLEDVRFEEALSLPDGETRRVQVVVGPSASGKRTIEVFASGGDAAGWVRHSSGRVVEARRGPATAPTESSADARARLAGHELDLAAWFERLRESFVDLGPDFRIVEELSVKDGEAFGEIALPPHLPAEAYVAHPVLLDGCFQVAGPLLAHANGAEGTYVPVAVEQLHIARPLGGRALCHARIRASKRPREKVVDVTVFAPDGSELARITGLTVRQLSSRSGLGLDASGLVDWLYDLSWEPGPRPRSMPATPAERGSWLVLADEGGFADGVVARLCETAPCHVVRAGARWEQRGMTFSIRPDQAEDYVRMLAVIRAEAGDDCRGIIHLWSLDAPSEPLSPDGLSRSEVLGPRSVLELLRAFGPDRLAPLLVVTRGAERVEDTAAEPPMPSTVAFGGAMLWGLSRSLRAERSGHVRIVDLDPRADVGAIERERAAVVGEVLLPDPEPEIAIREGERWVTRLRRVGRGELSREPYAWDPDGTYLVIGGLGAIGFDAARRMVAAGARHVVLAGRSRPSAEVEKMLSALNAEADVRFEQVDVSSRSDLERLLGKISRAEHPLRGVLHSAVVLRDGLITNQTWADYAAVLAPKVEGTANLYLALEALGLAERLDFVAYFASAASILGSPGQTNYAAANAFQDAMAHHETAAGRRAISIHWGPWSELGGDRWATAMQAWERRGVGAIDPERGFALLERLVVGGPRRVSVLPIDWRRFSTAWADAAVNPIYANLIRREAEAAPGGGAGVSGATDSILEALRKATPGEQRALVLAHVRTIVGRVLCIDPDAIDPAAPLSQLGLDSLVALQIKHRIERDLGVAVPVVALLKGAPIAAICDELARRLEAVAHEPSPAAIATPEVATPNAACADATRAIDAAEAARLLERVGELSDEEVDRELARLLAEQENAAALNDAD